MSSLSRDFGTRILICDVIITWVSGANNTIHMQIYTDYSRLFAPKHTFPAMILDFKKVRFGQPDCQIRIQVDCRTHGCSHNDIHWLSTNFLNHIIVSEFIQKCFKRHQQHRHYRWIRLMAANMFFTFLKLFFNLGINLLLDRNSRCLQFLVLPAVRCLL